MAQSSRRICLTGPESTGKTEAAGRLGRQFGLPWVAEYSREYAERRPILTAVDVEPIARGEIAALDAAPGEGLVILDTDLLSTVVYARYYYGSCPSWIEEEARRRIADLYLLFDTDVPWAADGLRDRGDEREDLFDQFRRTLDEFHARWTIISGTGERRWESILLVIGLMPPPAASG